MKHDALREIGSEGTLHLLPTSWVESDLSLPRNPDMWMLISLFFTVAAIDSAWLGNTHTPSKPG